MAGMFLSGIAFVLQKSAAVRRETLNYPSVFLLLGGSIFATGS
jgi:hypothetical protein